MKSTLLLLALWYTGALNAQIAANAAAPPDSSAVATRPARRIDGSIPPPPVLLAADSPAAERLITRGFPDAPVIEALPEPEPTADNTPPPVQLIEPSVNLAPPVFQAPMQHLSPAPRRSSYTRAATYTVSKKTKNKSRPPHRQAKSKKQRTGCYRF